MINLWLFSLLALISSAEFNGINVVALLSNYASEFNYLSSYALDYFADIKMTQKASKLFRSVQATDMTFNVTDMMPISQILKASSDVTSVKYLFDIIGCTHSTSVIRNFFSSTNYPNLCIQTTQHSSKLDFDVKISFVNGSTVFTLNSNPVLTAGTKYKMFTTSSTGLNTYLSDWVTGAGSKLISEYLMKVFDSAKIKKSLQASLNSLASDYTFSPFTYCYGNYIMNNVLDSAAPLISNQYVQFQFDGQVYLSGQSPLNSSLTTIPSSIPNILTSFQYIISQDMLQSAINSYQANSLFNSSFGVVYPDLTIYNATCTTVTIPQLKIMPSGVNIAMDEQCSFYTNYLNTFSMTYTFNSLISLSASTSSIYHGMNSIVLLPNYTTTVSSSNIKIIDPNPGLNYQIVYNHIGNISSIIIGNFKNAPDIPLPTPMIYTGMQWAKSTYYYNGYLAIGENSK